MAISRIKTWGAEVLTFAALNAEFDNILNNALALVSPWTANMAAGGFRLTGLHLGTAADPSLQFTGDTNTGIFSSGADTLDLATAGASWLRLSPVGHVTLLGTTGAFRTHNLTTAQRDALTPAAGMLVYNTTTGALNVYTSSWGAVGGGGAVATDVIWDAKGDLAVGTGPDTAAKLIVGTNGAHLIADSGATSGISWLLPATATVAASQNTTSTTYTDLATVGPAVTVTVGASGRALVTITSTIENNTTGSVAKMAFAVSGATTVAATDTTALVFINPSSAASPYIRASATTLVTGLTTGSNTFTAKYRAGANTATFTDREIIVIPF